MKNATEPTLVITPSAPEPPVCWPSKIEQAKNETLNLFKTLNQIQSLLLQFEQRNGCKAQPPWLTIKEYHAQLVSQPLFVKDVIKDQVEMWEYVLQPQFHRMVICFLFPLLSEMKASNQWPYKRTSLAIVIYDVLDALCVAPHLIEELLDEKAMKFISSFRDLEYTKE